MKTASTASTRPRLSAGVASGTSVERMNTLTASAPDSARSATNAITKLVVRPRTMVPTPNSATETSSVRPTRWLTGFHAKKIVTRPAPIPTAARSHPSPTAPTPRRSSAMAGSSAIGTAEQDREEVEGDGAEQDRAAAHEPQALHRLVHARALALLVGARARTPAASRASTVTAAITTSPDATTNGTHGSTT